MADRTVPGLRSAIKALRDVVAPAIDARDPLANEQLRMACAYLSLVCEQLPQRAARIVFELHQTIALAESIEAHARRCDPVCADALTEALTKATRCRDLADRSEGEAEATTAALQAAISATVRASAAADEGVRLSVERSVLAHSKDWLAAQRAWFAPLGFDLDKASLPPLAQALARRG